MPAIRSLIEPGRRVVSRHLNHLEGYGDRLRGSVSTVVGETVSALVRETIQAVLALEPVAPPPERYIPPRGPQLPPWMRTEDRYQDPWFEDANDVDRDGDDASRDDYAYTPPARAADSSPEPSRLPSALAVGIHTTLCWLRRRAGRYPVTTAVVVGLLTGLATFAGGPLAGAAVGLASSAYNLFLRRWTQATEDRVQR